MAGAASAQLDALEKRWPHLAHSERQFILVLTEHFEAEGKA